MPLYWPPTGVLRGREGSLTKQESKAVLYVISLLITGCFQFFMLRLYFMCCFYWLFLVISHRCFWTCDLHFSLSSSLTPSTYRGPAAQYTYYLISCVFRSGIVTEKYGSILFSVLINPWIICPDVFSTFPQPRICLQECQVISGGKLPPLSF